MTTELAPTQRLAGVQKEPHAKRRRGAAVAYLVVDREGEWAILGQKLHLLSRWINDHVVDGSPWARVSTTGLWGSVDRTDGRHGGWHKGRFRIRSVCLERAIEEWEATRTAYAKSAIVADQPSCYAICA
jgi:hypothetical protein